jgi:hypothetical protein
MREWRCILCLFLSTLPVFPQPPSSSELVEGAREWDGITVTFTGEAIGEALRRGGLAWIHLHVDSDGDVVEVVGVFNAACPEHGGDMDIHASTLRIVRPGHRVPHVVSRSRILGAGAMALATALAFGAWLLVRRRRA